MHRFGYIEFADAESVDNALKLDDSMFKGRQLKVLALWPFVISELDAVFYFDVAYTSHV